MLSTISFVIHNNAMGSSEANTRKINPPATTAGRRFPHDSQNRRHVTKSGQALTPADPETLLRHSQNLYRVSLEGYSKESETFIV